MAQRVSSLLLPLGAGAGGVDYRWLNHGSVVAPGEILIGAGDWAWLQTAAQWRRRGEGAWRYVQRILRL